MARSRVDWAHDGAHDGIVSVLFVAQRMAYTEA
jgi:hypothetical protein